MSARLSPDFTEAEFLVSQHAARMGRQIVLPEELRPNLILLCRSVLQPFRDAVRRKVTISSGFRPGWLNRAVGGSRNSEHTLALAADIVVDGMTVTEVCNTMVALKLPFGELIDEFGAWTHVSASIKRPPRREIWTARKVSGKTVYLAGLRG